MSINDNAWNKLASMPLGNIEALGEYLEPTKDGPRWIRFYDKATLDKILLMRGEVTYKLGIGSFPPTPKAWSAQTMIIKFERAVDAIKLQSFF